MIPNLRRMFVPPPGRGFFDLDLDSADLHVVTWESDCKWMKQAFATKKKPYILLAREYYHDETINKTLPNGAPDPKYQTFKKFCHGTNYLGEPPTMAGQCGLLVSEADRLQRWYFSVCPEIKTWQEQFRKRFMATGMVKNAFGNQCKFFERLDTPNLVNKAIAWIPQSTIGLLINRIWANIDEHLPDVWIHLQVHDSLLGSYPLDEGPVHLQAVRENARIVIPYADPLVIPVGLKTSELSWGDCE